MLNNLLYIAWQPDEYLVRFGSMGIRWYGMCWLVGFAVAYFLMRWLFKRHKIADEKFDPMFVYVFLGAFIGARLGHCFFYEPQDFFDSWQHFVEIFLPIKFLAGGGWKFCRLSRFGFPRWSYRTPRWSLPLHKSAQS